MPKGEEISGRHQPPLIRENTNTYGVAELALYLSQVTFTF